MTGPAARNARELAARTDNNRVVNFAGDAALLGTFTEIGITSAQPHSLRGEITA